MEAVAHKISFVCGGELHEFAFLSTAEDVHAFREAVPHAAKMEVSDFQVFATGTSVPGTCVELAGVMADAVTPQGATHTAATAAKLGAMRAAAASVDAAAAATLPEDLVTWTASFVWDNGGGDDNAFEQAFRGPARHPAVTAFATAMDDAMHMFAYDISLSVEPGLASDETLATAALKAADVLEGEGCEVLAYAVRQAMPAKAPAP